MADVVVMGPKRKADRSRHRSRSKWVFVSLILVFVVVSASAAYILYPKNPSTQPLNQTPQGLTVLANQYMQIMQNLNSSQTKPEIAQELKQHYNQTELFAWEIAAQIKTAVLNS